MAIIHLSCLIIIALPQPTLTRTGTKCFKEMNYHVNYGYGYDINCTNLTSSDMTELKSIEVFNEINLVIDRSTIVINNSNLFYSIPKIRRVFITRSNFSIGSDGSKFLDNLGYLTEVKLNGNRLVGIGEILGNLRGLRVLNLTDNGLREIKAGALKYVVRLEDLDLSYNKFAELQAVPFCDVPSLKRLFLRNNRIRLLTSKHFTCLKLLRELHLDNNEITRVSSLASLSLLAKVNLRFNSISELDTSLSNLESLSVIDLQGNKLTAVSSRDFLNLTNLRKLVLSKNLLTKISDDAFNGIRSLRELDLQDNNLVDIPVSKLTLLDKLVLSGNKLSTQIYTQLGSLSNLTYLQMRNCSLRFIEQSGLRHLISLIHLDVSNNKISLASNSFHGFHSLEELIMTENSITRIPNFAFTFVPNLKILDVSCNRLKSINNVTFYNLANLQVLNMSYNYLDELEEVNLQAMAKLEVLDVEGNRLEYIDYDDVISLLSKLRVINVRENRFTCEFLSDMVRYFKHKQINYTVNGKVRYDGENVGGIYCQESYSRSNQSLRRRDDNMESNEKRRTRKEDEDVVVNVSRVVLLALTVLVFFVGLVIAFQRVRASEIRRRLLLSDSVELLETAVFDRTYVR